MHYTHINMLMEVADYKLEMQISCLIKSIAKPNEQDSKSSSGFQYKNAWFSWELDFNEYII